MKRPIVYLVDDDHAVRDSLAMLLRSVDLDVFSYGSAQSFLSSFDANDSVEGCLILDVRMPGLSGFAVQERINKLGSQIPIIFITGHGDMAQCRKAFKEGAVDFLTKPVDEQTLLDSLYKAIDLSRSLIDQKNKQQETQTKFARLTNRERQVYERIIWGVPNKTIATELSISLRTVEVHRASVFDKLEVDSLAELVRLGVEDAQLVGDPMSST